MVDTDMENQRDQQNLRRRERRAGQAANQTLINARAEAKTILDHATEEAREAHKLLDAAREEAISFREQILVEFSGELAAKDQRIQELQSLHDELQSRFSILSEQSSRNGNDAAQQMEPGLAKRLGARERQQKSRKARNDLLHDLMDLDPSADPNRTQRSQRLVVTEIVKQFCRLTKGHNWSSKKSIMERFWTHKAMVKFHPTTLGCPKADLSWKAVAIDVKKVLNTVKFARRRDHKAAKDIILASLAGNQVVTQRYQSSLARALCIKRAPVYAASKKRAILDGDESLRFPLGQRKERSDRLSEEIRGDCAWFWENFTRPSPNAKDLAKKRIARKENIEHRVHRLEDTEVTILLHQVCSIYLTF